MPDAFELLTPRLRLRPLRNDDLQAFATYRSDPAVARFQGWEAPYGPDAAAGLLDAQRDVRFGEPGRWLQIAVTDRADGALCGDCAVHVLADMRATAELGVTLAPERHGRGLAAEALAALVEALFHDLGMHRVIAQVDERNDAARRLFAGLGFREEGRFVDADWFKGGWSTLCLLAMLEREWPPPGYSSTVSGIT